LAFSALSHGSEKIDGKDVLYALEAAIGSIRSYDVLVKATMRIFIHSDTVGPAPPGTTRPMIKNRLLRQGEAPMVVRQYSRQVYLKGRGRVEIMDGAGGTGGKISTYDNVEAKSFNVRTGDLFISRSIGGITMDGGDYRETFRRVSRGVNLDLLAGLKERVKYLQFKEPQKGQPFVIVEAPPVGKEIGGVSYPQWAFRVKLDPRRKMLPASIEVFQPLGADLRLYRRTTVEQWKDIGEGTWVPTKARTRIFAIEPENREIDGQVANEIVLDVDVVHSSWNKQIGKEVFNLPLPAGTRVTDTERGVRYVTGKADPGKNLSDLARNARNAVPFTTGPNAEIASWQSWKAITGYMLVVGVAVGIACFFLRRKWQRSAQ
jgi:hypothetical protein